MPAAAVAPMGPEQWRRDVAMIGLWTMDSTDMNIGRALSRHAASYEDERAAWIRLIREIEETADREAVRRQEAEEQLGAYISAFGEARSAFAAGVVHADPQPKEAAEEDEGDAEEEGEEEEDEDADDMFDDDEDDAAAAAREEVEYYQQQCIEADARTDKAVAELKEQKALVKTLEASLAAAMAAQADSTASTGLESEIAKLKLSNSQKDAMLQKQAADAEKAARELATLADNAATAAKELEEQKILMRTLQQALDAAMAHNAAAGDSRDEIQRLRIAENRNEAELQRLRKVAEGVAAKDKMIADLKSELQSFKARYDKLKQSIEPKHMEPDSKEVQDYVASVSDNVARKMTGTHTTDYPILFDHFFDYQKELTRRDNEILSLNTIIHMREDDVGNDLTTRFSRERADLQGQIKTLELQLQQATGR